MFVSEGKIVTTIEDEASVVRRPISVLLPVAFGIIYLLIAGLGADIHL